MEQAQLVRDADASLAEAERLTQGPEADLRARASEESWNVAQHLEHLSHAAQLSLRSVQKIARGEGEPREGKADVLARRVLRSGTIPRGAQAPDSSRPSGDGDLELSRANLVECRASLRDLGSAELGDETLPHPILGGLNALEWLRFADIHTRHHLAQIRELLERS